MFKSFCVCVYPSDVFVIRMGELNSFIEIFMGNTIKKCPVVLKPELPKLCWCHWLATSHPQRQWRKLHGILTRIHPRSTRVSLKWVWKCNSRLQSVFPEDKYRRFPSLLVIPGSYPIDDLGLILYTSCKSPIYCIGKILSMTLYIWSLLKWENHHRCV